MALFVRKDVWALGSSDPTIKDYRRAVAAMKAKPATDPTSWSYQAAIHGSYTTPAKPLWNQCKHGTWFFLSWHRMYLYYFERIVRAEVIANGGSSSWALPYWNYDGGGNDNTLPRPFRNQTLGNGDPNPLWVGQRRPHINTGLRLPSSITSPAFALSRTSFTGAAQFGGGVTGAMQQFFAETGRVEQTPHNDIHVAVGGLMGDPDTAARDPIFWLHHANIDRLWWLWEKTHANPSDTRWTDHVFKFFDESGKQVSLTGSDVVQTAQQLGYKYETVAPMARAVAGPPAGPPQPPRVDWPGPWPRREGVAPATAGPEEGSDVVRHLIGASEEPVRLIGEPTRVRVNIDERSAQSLQRAAVAPTLRHRAFVDVEDIEAERNPGTIYGVYVNLPDDPTPQDLEEHHVGNISLFGVERARDPRGDAHGHGLKVSMEVTDLLDRLAAEGKWTDGQQLDVTFRPIELEAPEDQPDVAGEIAAATAHPDGPVTIGRVSVHYD